MAASVAIGLLGPGPAFAHAPLPGLEGFYAGLLHPWTTPTPALAILALGLRLAQSWPTGFLRSWLLFAAALLGGLLIGPWSGTERLLRPGLLLLATATASLAVLAPGRFRLGGTILGACSGLLVGAVSAPDPGPLAATLFTSFGSLFGASLALLYVSGGLGSLLVRFDRPWLRIGLRILAARGRGLPDARTERRRAAALMRFSPSLPMRPS